MLAVSGGRLLALSTPFGKRGWFHREWSGAEPWRRVRVAAHECPRIDPDFLDEERRTMGELYYRSEYLCEFADSVDAVFRHEDVMAALAADVAPLFPPSP